MKKTIFALISFLLITLFTSCTQFYLGKSYESNDGTYKYTAEIRDDQISFTKTSKGNGFYIIGYNLYSNGNETKSSNLKKANISSGVRKNFTNFSGTLTVKTFDGYIEVELTESSENTGPHKLHP